jgi:hypothetical protein
VLGLEPPVVDDKGVAIPHAGDSQVEIFGPGTGGRTLTSPPVPAFEVEDVEDVEAAREELLVAGVELLGDIGRWNGFEWQYFRGPDGHVFSVKKTPAAG